MPDTMGIVKSSLFNHLISNIQEALILLDQEKNIISLNSIAENILGCSLSKTLGLSFKEFCESVHWNYQIFNKIEQLKIGGKILHFTTFLDNENLSWKAEYIKSNEGCFLSLMTQNYHDIEMVNSLIRLETLLENMPCNVYWVDNQCKMLGCNRNVLTMLNMTREEFIGKTYEELSILCSWPQGLAEKLKGDDLHVLNTGQPIFGVEDPPIPHSNNTLLYLLTSRVPIRNSRGDITAIAGISVDISNLKEAKEKVEAANYIMTEFISNMGHILVTPFSTISGVATRLLYGYSDKYLELKSLFEELMQGCTEWEKMYNQVIKGTSVSEMELKVESFSINKELHVITDIMKPAAGAKNLELIFQPFEPQDEDLIETDKLKFHLILIELISNAIHFTEKGQVVISISKDNCTFDIRVSDTGIGIPPDKLDYIFEQYTMLSRSQKHGANFKGVGAGLFLAKQRARLLDAKILTTSELSKSSTFTLSIPNHPVYNTQ